jgi:hypothetical protein
MLARRTVPIVLALLLGAAALAVAVTRATRGEREEASCPPGFTTAAQRERMGEREKRYEALRGDAGEESDRGEADHEEADGEGGAGCQPLKHPESLGDIAAVNAFRSVRVTAPATAVRAGAYAGAVGERDALARAPRTLAGTGGTWEPAGRGPLVADDDRYDQVNGLGLGDLNGRVTDFAWDAQDQRLLASVGEGGVWASDDRGQQWSSIGDGLPTQAVGSVAFVPAKGDRPDAVLALTGDDVFGGGSTYSGLGVYRTTDGGQTWTRSAGVPDAALGFRLKVDPADSDVVYAATGRGLFRSTDGGASFANVELPTGSCAGDTTTTTCYLANMVTDVAIQAPGGVTNARGGAVVAAVGWRAGNKENVGGFVESPGNGVYVSDSGAPGTFAKIDPNASGFASGTTATGDFQDAIGRIELGAATGPKQDHGYLYAIVQDASAFKKGEVSGVDVPEQSPQATPSNTYLRGVYVSKDFGHTWTLMANAAALQAPTTGSALSAYACATLYCPGIQAWYNEWIEPDPTQASASGVPTRLTFGLEEVWQNDDLPAGRQPADGPTAFKVIGRYFGGTTCQFLDLGLPSCPTNRGEPNSYTIHPDQHGAIYVPRDDGGVTLVVGNDGGAYQQTAFRNEELTNTKWGRGANLGFNTLLPYDAQVAKDGTIYAGLQDNGEERIEPSSGRQSEVYGGDGGYSAVDPDNSDIAYEEYVLGDMRATTDGGRTWTDITPPDDSYQFINPFVMDPGDPSHLMTAGTKVYETTKGPSTTTDDWKTVFDLGTAPSGAPNQMSAIDVRSVPTGGTQGLPTGPKTADVAYTGGATAIPGAGSGAPGTYDDHPFTIGPDDGDSAATVKVTWSDASNDWDLHVLRNEGGQLVEVGSSAQGNTTREQVVLTNPAAGDYVVRVDNFAATGTFAAAVTFTQRTADPPATKSVAYVGFCGYCDPLNTRPFDNGVATSAGGTWHLARAAGLPRRYITSIQADPVDPSTVYVTLGGYSRRWLPVGALGESTRDVGEGHVFRSTDAGDTFTDISGNLPDVPAEFTVVRNGQLVVATDVGVYLAAGTNGGDYQPLGHGLPAAPVYSLELKPKASDSEPDTLVAATQGRGVYRYVFADPEKPAPAGAGAATPTARASSAPGARAAARSAATASRAPLFALLRIERAGPRALRAVFRLREPAAVGLRLSRAGRTVRALAAHRYRADRTYSVRLAVARAGTYRVTLRAASVRATQVRTLSRRL